MELDENQAESDNDKVENDYELSTTYKKIMYILTQNLGKILRLMPQQKIAKKGEGFKS